jgi:mannitol-1-/sugar-/sorbitol-6-phosphatase
VECRYCIQKEAVSTRATPAGGIVLAQQIVTCKAVLFDMDGVLVDSTRAVARVWGRWAEERGFDPEHVAQIAQGRPSITTIRELLPEADHEAENRIVERREIEDIADTNACPGAVELLQMLPPDRWVLVTSSTRPLAEVRLRAGGHAAPRYVITGSDVQRGKPDPEPFVKAAAMIGEDPRECLVVEDSPAGIRAGKAAGCRVLALRTTMSDDVLESAGPDWIVDNCASVRLVEVTRAGDLRLAFDT